MSSTERLNPEQASWCELVEALRAAKGERPHATLDYIIACLQKGKIEEARIECMNNGDKLESMQDVVVALSNGLFPGKKTFSDNPLFGRVSKENKNRLK